jgi:hypothetical protein
MKKQALRFFAMVLLVIMVAFISALASSVSAQTPSHNINANIPFEFNVGDQTLPAGQYKVGRVSIDATMMAAINRNIAVGAHSPTIPVKNSMRKNQSTLVFRRYGSRYFLAEIWRSGEMQGRALLKTRQERAIERELAKNNQEVETVTVIAVLQ